MSSISGTNKGLQIAGNRSQENQKTPSEQIAGRLETLKKHPYPGSRLYAQTCREIRKILEKHPGDKTIRTQAESALSQAYKRINEDPHNQDMMIRFDISMIHEILATGKLLQPVKEGEPQHLTELRNLIKTFAPDKDLPAYPSSSNTQTEKPKTLELKPPQTQKLSQTKKTTTVKSASPKKPTTPQEEIKQLTRALAEMYPGNRHYARYCSRLREIVKSNPDIQIRSHAFSVLSDALKKLKHTHDTDKHFKAHYSGEMHHEMGEISALLKKVKPRAGKPEPSYLTDIRNIVKEFVGPEETQQKPVKKEKVKSPVSASGLKKPKAASYAQRLRQFFK